MISGETRGSERCASCKKWGDVPALSSLCPACCPPDFQEAPKPCPSIGCRRTEGRNEVEEDRGEVHHGRHSTQCVGQVPGRGGV